MINLKQNIMSFIRKIPYMLFLTAILLIFYSAKLPPTENGNEIVVIANYKWIAKLGKMTISEGPAKPVLKSLETGEKFTPKYFDKSYAYFYNLKLGDYILDDILLDAGNMKLHLKTVNKVRIFRIEKPGVLFIGGMDIVDYQTKMKFIIHDSIQVKKDIVDIRKHFSNRKNGLEERSIIVLDSLLIQNKW
jgi:hypothetical protein